METDSKEKQLSKKINMNLTQIKFVLNIDKVKYRCTKSACTKIKNK